MTTIQYFNNGENNQERQLVFLPCDAVIQPHGDENQELHKHIFWVNIVYVLVEEYS